LRRSTNRREQRNGFLAALVHATLFAGTAKRERPKKGCALRRATKTDWSFFALFRARFVEQARAATFYSRAKLRERWPKQRTVERQDINDSRTLQGRNSINTDA
jgi:stalled ribosome alternative rescue factor ArfA